MRRDRAMRRGPLKLCEDFFSVSCRELYLYNQPEQLLKCLISNCKIEVELLNRLSERLLTTAARPSALVSSRPTSSARLKLSAQPPTQRLIEATYNATLFCGRLPAESCSRRLRAGRSRSQNLAHE